MSLSSFIEKETISPTPRSVEQVESDGGRPRQTPGLFSRARLLGAVEKEHGSLALLACCLVTGMVDAAVFSNWECFVGMQTGNTVLLGLSTAGFPSSPWAWLTTLVSIVSFLVGAFVTFRTSNALVPNGPSSNRLWNGTLFIVQGLFILVAAALAQVPGLIPQNPGNTNRDTINRPEVIENVLIVALIPLLGLQSGMQIATSRLLGFNELPVNVLTSTYCDIMGDFKLLAPSNVKRNRRVSAVFLLLIGAIGSGWLLRSSGGLPSVLWISAGIKVLSGFAIWTIAPTAK